MTPEAALAAAILASRSTTHGWKGSARATEATVWDRTMAKRSVVALRDLGFEVAAIRAESSAEALDVKRLARALHEIDGYGPGHAENDSAHRAAHDADARAIAAEYAALRDDDAPERIPLSYECPDCHDVLDEAEYEGHRLSEGIDPTKQGLYSRRRDEDD